MITTAAQARAAIIEAVQVAGKQAILDEVVTFRNTTENDIDDAGDVWVCNPQSGRWLSDDALINFARSLA